eukprot:366312-Chlamydomonas_euryale.AAC.2
MPSAASTSLAATGPDAQRSSPSAAPGAAAAAASATSASASRSTSHRAMPSESSGATCALAPTAGAAAARTPVSTGLPGRHAPYGAAPNPSLHSTTPCGWLGACHGSRGSPAPDPAPSSLDTASSTRMSKRPTWKRRPGDARRGDACGPSDWGGRSCCSGDNGSSRCWCWCDSCGRVSAGCGSSSSQCSCTGATAASLAAALPPPRHLSRCCGVLPAGTRDMACRVGGGRCGSTSPARASGFLS